MGKVAQSERGAALSGEFATVSGATDALFE
jgi:hypothetical protein